MLQGFLQRGDLAEPGTILCLGEAGFGVAGHLFDARQLGGVDAEEPAPAAGVLVDTGCAVRAVAVAEGDLAQQEVLLELVPFLPGRRSQLAERAELARTPRYERVLLLLAMALMEAHGIEVQIAAEPELAEIEGFVLADDLIVANWLRGPGLWYVDTEAPSSRWSMYHDISRETADKSIIAHPTPAGRLHAMAAYLDIPWTWFANRSAELAATGIDGLAHPRSRLLSTEGLMTALRYVANLNQPQTP
jgi:hypothetical protein